MSCYDRYRHEREGEDAARWGYLDRDSRERYDEGRRGAYGSCERAFADGVDRARRRQEEERAEEAEAERAAEARREEARQYEAQFEQDYYYAQQEAEPAQEIHDAP